MPFVVGNCHSVFILDTCTLRLIIIRFNCQFPMVILFLCIIKFFIFKKELERDERIVLQVSDMTQGPLVIFRSYLNLLEKQNENTCFTYLTPFDSPSLKLQLALLWCVTYIVLIHTLSVFTKQLTVLGKHLFWGGGFSDTFVNNNSNGKTFWV